MKETLQAEYRFGLQKPTQSFHDLLVDNEEEKLVSVKIHGLKMVGMSTKFKEFQSIRQFLWYSSVGEGQSGRKDALFIGEKPTPMECPGQLRSEWCHV